jgi:hypothetical protein
MHLAGHRHSRKQFAPLSEGIRNMMHLRIIYLTINIQNLFFTYNKIHMTVGRLLAVSVVIKIYAEGYLYCFSSFRVLPR